MIVLISVKDFMEDKKKIVDDVFEKFHVRKSSSALIYIYFIKIIN